MVVVPARKSSILARRRGRPLHGTPRAVIVIRTSAGVETSLRTVLSPTSASGRLNVRASAAGTTRSDAATAAMTTRATSGAPELMAHAVAELAEVDGLVGNEGGQDRGDDGNGDQGGQGLGGRDQRREQQRHRQARPVEAVHIAPAEGHVREQVQGGASEQRDRGDELELVVHVD